MLAFGCYHGHTQILMNIFFCYLFVRVKPFNEQKVNERLLYQTSKRSTKVNSPVWHKTLCILSSKSTAFASKYIGDGQLDLNTDA